MGLGVIELFIVKVMCTTYMIPYACSAKRSSWGRIGSLLMVVVMWFPHGTIPGLLWGAVCWAESRIPER